VPGSPGGSPCSPPSGSSAWSRCRSATPWPGSPPASPSGGCPGTCCGSCSPGVAERVLGADDWAFYRRWAWNDAKRGQDPDLDRQLADLSRPGALVAGLNWYRANIDPVAFVAPDPARFSLPSVACPTMGVWSSGDFALTEAQMTHSERFVTGPWRYERIDDVDHWVPVHAPDQLNRLLLEFLGS
jgi:pimeloyl-ACP methyl ester carboxylesterase